MQTKMLKTREISTKTLGLFALPSALQLNHQLLKDVEMTLPYSIDVIRLAIEEYSKSESLTDEQKLEITNQFLNFCLENAEKIMELIEEPEILKQIEGLMAPALPNELESTSNEEFQFAHFLFETAKVLGLGALSTYSPTFALVLAASLPSAAQAFNASEVIINSGIYNGGIDLCAGLVHCIQGYIFDPMQNDTYSFSRDFSGSFQRGKLIIDISGVMSCLSNTQIGTALAEYLETSTGNASATCYATKIIPNYQITARVTGTNIPDASCNGFQQAFDPVLENCIFPRSNWVVNVAVAGGVVGAIAAIVAIALISMKTHCCTKSCCDDEEEESPSPT